MSTSKIDGRAELERTLSELGLKPQTYRALMLLPLVYVAWADGKMDHVEVSHILEFAGRRLHLTPETAAVVDRWLKEAPSRAYVERGLQGLLGIALDEHMLEVDVSELPELVLHAETIAAATGDALHDPNSVTPEEEEALREIARLLEVESGDTWKGVLDSLRTQRPPAG
jgi:tellurite resistance protein